MRSFPGVKGFTAINAFGAMPDQITLLDGSTVQASDIRFDPVSYHEYLISTGADITSLMKQGDKTAIIPGFDIGVDDDRVYRETTVARGYKDPGPPSGDTGAGYILSQTIKSSAAQLAQVASPAALKSDLKDLIFFAVIGLAIFYGIGFRE